MQALGHPVWLQHLWAHANYAFLDHGQQNLLQHLAQPACFAMKARGLRLLACDQDLIASFVMQVLGLQLWELQNLHNALHVMLAHGQPSRALFRVRYALFALKVRGRR